MPRGTKHFSHGDMLSSIEDFLEIYKERPIKDNFGGMGINNSWATWYVLTRVKPDIVIESGVYKGHSTWLIEKAVPSAKVLSFDLSFELRTYTSKKVNYFEYDFFQHDWSSFDLKKAVAVFDDHQNQYDRLIKGSWLGIRHFIFDDVFPVGEGDCYSLKHLQKGSGAPHLQMSRNYQGRLIDKYRRGKKEKGLWSLGTRQNLLVKPNTHDRANLYRKNVSIFEIPPIHLKSDSLWGTKYEGEYKTQPSLLNNEPISSVDYSYTFPTYVSL